MEREKPFEQEEKKYVLCQAVYESLYIYLCNLISTQPMIVFMILKLRSSQVIHAGNLSENLQRSVTEPAPQFSSSDLTSDALSLCFTATQSWCQAHSLLPQVTWEEIVCQSPVWSSFCYSCSSPGHSPHSGQGGPSWLPCFAFLASVCTLSPLRPWYSTIPPHWPSFTSPDAPNSFLSPSFLHSDGRNTLSPLFALHSLVPETSAKM